MWWERLCLGCYLRRDFSVKMDEVRNPVMSCALACAIAAVISQIGDLAASAIKRNHNIKDYGNLIPGHGGILDRFDSVIFTAPAIYFALMFLQLIRACTIRQKEENTNEKNSDTWDRPDRSEPRPWKWSGQIRDIGVTALAAGSNIDLLEKQIREFHPTICGSLERGKGKRTDAIACSDLDIKCRIRHGWTPRSRQRSWMRRLW